MSSETPVTEVDKYGASLQYDPEFRGPVKSRSCTDIICLFLFIAFLAGWIVVGIFAFREGDPRVLLYPTDSLGNICGIGKFENKKHLFFFDLMKCASPQTVLKGCPTPQVCVESCPNETFYVNPISGTNEEYKNKLICKYDSDRSKSVNQLVKDGDCAQLYFNSTTMMERCIPVIFLSTLTSQTIKDYKNNTITGITVDDVKNATGTLAKFLSIKEVGEKVFSDLKRSWHLILLGLVMAMLLSLVWIILMRWITAPMVWLSIILVLVFCAYACYKSTDRYIQLKNDPGSNEKFKLTLNLRSYLALRKTWLAFAIISGLVFLILALVLIFLRKRLRIAIALITEASRAVGSMVSSLFFPIITYVFMLIVFAFWVSVALYIASSGKASYVITDAPNNSEYANGSICNPKNFNATGAGIKCIFQSYGLKDNIFSAHVYNLFALFWGSFFCIGMGQVSLAGAFAAYYWTLDKKKVPSFAVMTGFYRCVRFHLGSVAFGSLLIAIVRMIRVMLEYLDQKLKQYDNKFVKFLLWCMKCCFWCLENILKFISKNAFIMVAIYGKNFCTSAKRAFMLIMRNILRVVVLDKVTDFLLFIGKLVIVCITAIASFYTLASEKKIYKKAPDLNFNLLPPIIITFGAYVIASAFFSVYGMAVNTLFLCFLEDCERNDGSPEKPYYMSKELMKILDKKNRFQEPSSPQ